MKNTLEFKLKPTSREIKKAGEKGTCFFKSHGFSDDMVQVQLMILRELIKNGIKYGKSNPPPYNVTVHLHLAENTVIIEVMVPVDDTCSDRLISLDKTILFIKGYQDPYEPYAMLKRNCHNDGEANGIGLARIAYKGKADLDFYVSEDNILNLSAVRNLNGDLRI